MRLDGRDLQSLYRCHVTAHVMLPSFPLMSTAQGLLSCKSKQPLVVLYRHKSACKHLQAQNIRRAEFYWQIGPSDCRPASSQGTT